MEKRKKEMPDVQRQYWLWATRLEHWGDEDGNDNKILEPSGEADDSIGWTCHKNTKIGDLILLWRGSPKRDIGYLIQAASDAYSIADDEDAIKHGWDYACEFKVLFKFANPVTIQDVRDSPYLEDWSALRGNFQRLAFKIPPEHWERLIQLASKKNPDFQRFLDSFQPDKVPKKKILEEQIEKALVHNLSLLKPDYDLELYRDPNTGVTGQQLVCSSIKGRIDLLCYDSKAKQFVVIELKVGRAEQKSFSQICMYLGWVKDRIAEGIPVVGLLISRGYDAKFESMMKVVSQQVFYLDVQPIIQQLGLE